MAKTDLTNQRQVFVEEYVRWGKGIKQTHKQTQMEFLKIGISVSY